MYTLQHKTFNYTLQLKLHLIIVHNATTITIHEKHLIYTMQLQLQFMENI